MNDSKAYVDRRGWTYRVMPGLGGNTFKARYCKPGATNWKCVSYLPWRDTAEKAQADLDEAAHTRGWEATA